MIIKPYEDIYRDDLIFMVLQAKEALGRKPRINDDLLNITAHYFDCGDMFWIAVDEKDRVIGCVGYSRIPKTTEAFLHRLYIKPSEKRKGIGTQLLKIAESEMKNKGITAVLVHLGTPKEQWFESYSFYPRNGYCEFKPCYMRKEL